MPFHLSHPDERDAIISNGIEADAEGYIDVFTDNMVANTIARDQLFLDRYDVFWITPTGITAELEPNLECGITSPYQFRIRQSRVAEQFLRLMGEHEVVFDRPTAWDYFYWKRVGFLNEDVNDQFRILRDFRANRISAEQANAHFAEITKRVNARLQVRRRVKLSRK
ncbi:MAG TPA: hypothetical protein VFE47_03155 [Tepidisphaeraceae bacterium]|jgi:hypothetical protein|nr:hypothetical protein [Tepidisphaeraceae bacterium]